MLRLSRTNPLEKKKHCTFHFQLHNEGRNVRSFNKIISFNLAKRVHTAASDKFHLTLKTVSVQVSVNSSVLFTGSFSDVLVTVLFSIVGNIHKVTVSLYVHHS